MKKNSNNLPKFTSQKNSFANQLGSQLTTKRAIAYGDNSIDKIDYELDYLIEKKWTLKEMMFSKLYKKTDEIRTSLAHVSASAREAEYRSKTEAQLAVMKEEFEAGIMMVKAEYRAKFSSFVLRKHEELREEISNHQIEFFEEMKGKYEFLESLKDHKSLYTKYSSIIDTSIHSHSEFVEEIINKFKSLLKEEIESY